MILVNNPGTWSHIYPPLKHAKWHGLTPTDLVFPFFLFAVGNAMAFVIPRLKEKGQAAFWKKIFKRLFLIFGIGLFLNWYPFFRLQDGEFVFKAWQNGESGVRIMGVLQRIALAYFFASIIIYFTKLRHSILVAIALLVAYWLVVFFGNPTAPYSIHGFIGNDIDKAILGIAHMYKGEGMPFDPEGLLSTIPCIAQVILGYWVGAKIITHGKTNSPTDNLVAQLFIAAVGLLVIGYVWGLTFPVNKKIWTSSYVLVTTGLATAILATIIYFIEFKDKKLWLSEFFNVFGKNPLFIFALSAFFPKTARLFPLGDGLTFWNWPYKKIFQEIPGSPEFGSLLYALLVILFMWMIAYFMDKKGIYVKV